MADANEFLYKTVTDDPSALSQAETSILRTMNKDRQEHHLPPLKAEPVLSRVAHQHSEDMKKYGYFSEVSARLGEIRYQVRRAGISSAMVYHQICQVPSLETLLDELRGDPRPVHLGEETHVGIGAAESAWPRGYHVTLIFINCQAFLDPFPAVVKPGETRRLSGRFSGELRRPAVSIYPPPGASPGAGGVLDLKVQSSETRAFQTDVIFDRGPGEYVIEVTAEGPLGPTVTDLLKVYAGVSYAPPKAPPADEKLTGADQAQALMLQLLKEDRMRFGLKALTSDGALAAVARAHSTDMMKNNFFAHVSPNAGDLSARLQRAGIALRSFGENIATDPFVRRAQENLMESPQHRRNILSPEFDRVGIGIVRDGGGAWYITQDFGQGFPTYDPKACAEAVCSEINVTRTRGGQPPVRRDDVLDRIAEENSKSMGEKGQLATHVAHALLKKQDVRGYALVLVLMSTDKPALGQMQPPEARELQRFDRMGISVVEQKDTSGAPRWWTTVVLVDDGP